MKKTILFLLIVLTLLMFAVGIQQGAGATGPSREKLNTAVVEKVFAAVNSKDIVPLNNLMSEELAKKTAKTLGHWWKKFADVKAEIHDIFASGDKVTVRWAFNGMKDQMLQEDWLVDYISIFRLADGKVVENWNGDNYMRALMKHGFTIKPPAPKTIEGRLRVTMSDMHTIGRAIKYYLEDYHHAPKANSIKELSKQLQPFYIKTLPLADAWENEFLYKVDPGDPKNYRVASPGSDGKFGGFDQEGTWKLAGGEKGRDIVLFNGVFTYKPDLDKK